MSSLCPHGKHPTFRGDASMFCAECNAATVNGAQARHTAALEVAARVVARLAVSPHVSIGDRQAVEREVVEAVLGG